MNLIILDADVIIHFLEIGIWEKFLEKNKVFLTETLIREDVKYYFPQENQNKKIHVNLFEYARSGNLHVVSLNVKDLDDFEMERKKKKAPELDLGEKEILAEVFLEKLEKDIKICLAETPAIICAVFIDLGENCISAEKALAECGLQRRLKNQFSEEWFKNTKRKAEIEKIVGI